MRSAPKKASCADGGLVNAESRVKGRVASPQKKETQRTPERSETGKTPKPRAASHASQPRRASAATTTGAEKAAPKNPTRPKAAATKSTAKKSAAKKSAAKKSAAAPGSNAAPATVSRPQVLATYKKLTLAHPDAHCELNHESPFQLIVATALSAQSTDVQVNKVTPGLFARFPNPLALSRAKPEEVESCINSLGMFRQKAKNLIGLAQGLVRDHDGQVPQALDALVRLPGVGRKTANVVLGVAFQAPVGVVVDTHVQRITQRLGWTTHSDPLKIEQDLMDLLPRRQWDRVSHTLIFHGRRICVARKPACSTCPVNRSCLHAFSADEVGRKPKRARGD